MKIKPLSDYIVVDTKEKAETTKSGFILPSASADKYVTAKAVAVGKGATTFGNTVEMATVRTEFAFVYCATGTRPAFVLCRSLRTAFRTEIACHRSSARAFPCARF